MAKENVDLLRERKKEDIGVSYGKRGRKSFAVLRNRKKRRGGGEHMFATMQEAYEGRKEMGLTTCRAKRKSQGSGETNERIPIEVENVAKKRSTRKKKLGVVN